jgi:outer membrane protein OmpA-like peptidoglycan-associated protein
MWRCHPGKWVVPGVLAAALPILAAWWWNTDKLTTDITHRASESLSRAGIDWAKLSFEGRDGTLSGDSPSDDALDAAVRAVAGTYGVRRLENHVRVVPPPPPVTLLAPTIGTITTNLATPEIKGTWQQDVAKTLAVTAAGKTYALGKDPELSSKAGEWTLKPAQALADGSYDVTAEVSDGVNPPVASTKPGQIIVDTKPPAPAVATAAVPVTAAPFALAGTWGEGDATGLTATLGGKTWTLNKDDAFTSAGKGTWNLVPDIALAPGSYDLQLAESDAAGNVSNATVVGAIVVPEPPRPMTAPTIATLKANEAQPAISGTWCEPNCATGLAVTLDDKTYTLNSDAALTSDGKGTWTLKPTAPLSDGSHKLSVVSTDRDGKTLAGAGAQTIVIDAAPPAAPTVAASESQASPQALHGTWAEGDATQLTVSVPQANLSAKLGDGSGALTSDGKGAWTLTLKEPLKPGSYDVVVESADAQGRIATDQSHAEIVINEPPRPVVAPPTVTVDSADVSAGIVSGTWDAAHATGLKVAIPEASLHATLNADAGLTQDNGKWTWKLPAPLPPGTYKVVVATTDTQGKDITNQSTDEIVVKAPPVVPAAVPTVNAFSGDTSPETISGTWDAVNAIALKVSIPGAKMQATLNADSALTQDNGKWTLKLAQPLSPGAYDVVVETVDKGGTVTQDQSTAEIYIKAPPPPPPVVLAAPTVAAVAVDAAPASVSGSFDEKATGLKVSIPGLNLSATLNKDAALTQSGGTWTLKLPPAIAPGAYNVVVEETAPDGKVTQDQSTAEIYVKAPPPPPPVVLAAPTVAAVAVDAAPASVSGSFDEKATGLKVSIPGLNLAATLNHDSALTQSGGTWTLKLPPSIAPGAYNVVVEETASDGKVTQDQSTAEIYIKAPPPPPPPAPAAYDCAKALADIGTATPIRFGFNHIGIRQEYDAAIAAYADVLKDPRCATVKVSIKGHADYFGPRAYNQILSQERAQTVLDMLVAKGVDAARLATIGLSEDQPTDPERSIEARQKNRRVEITTVQ